MRLILASTSSYRRELLARLGLPFEVATPRYTEEHDLDLDPDLGARADGRVAGLDRKDHRRALHRHELPREHHLLEGAPERSAEEAERKRERRGRPARPARETPDPPRRDGLLYAHLARAVA